MPQVRPTFLLRLLPLVVLLATPLPSIAADHSSKAERAWSSKQRASAEAMISRLDMTSFPNSIGPQRAVGKTTLEQYGFTKRSAFDDGWAYARLADGSWEFGIFVLDDGDSVKDLCVTDSAIGGGTYHTTIALEAKRQPDGFWRSSLVLPAVTGCK